MKTLNEKSLRRYLLYLKYKAWAKWTLRQLMWLLIIVASAVIVIAVMIVFVNSIYQNN
jgi:hypothetical protein